MSLLTFARTNSFSAYYNHLKYDSSDSNFKNKSVRVYSCKNQFSLKHFIQELSHCAIFSAKDILLSDMIH